MTKIVKNTATIEYLSKGWKDEAIGTTDKVHLNRLKVAIERLPFPQQPPELIKFVELMMARGEVSDSYRSFIKAWYDLPNTFGQPSTFSCFLAPDLRKTSPPLDLRKNGALPLNARKTRRVRKMSMTAETAVLTSLTPSFSSNGMGMKVLISNSRSLLSACPLPPRSSTHPKHEHSSSLSLLSSCLQGRPSCPFSTAMRSAVCPCGVQPTRNVWQDHG